jgi:hypothetical protein
MFYNWSSYALTLTHCHSLLTICSCGYHIVISLSKDYIDLGFLSVSYEILCNDT